MAERNITPTDLQDKLAGGGRTKSPDWALFSADSDAHLQHAGDCRLCKLVIHHGKKIDRVRSHLCSCNEFIGQMMDVDVSKRPLWFVHGGPNKKFHHTPTSISTSTLTPTSTKQISSMKQSSMKNFTLPPLSKADMERIHDCIALHFYITGSSFIRVEEKHLLQAFKIARPDIKLPSQKKLGGECLNRCFDKIALLAEDEQKNTAILHCLTTDGTTNIQNCAVINYMLINSNRTLFLETLETAEQSHNGEFLASDLSRVIENLETLGTAVAGAVTDNTAANKSAWALLKQKYPKKYFHGCASHGLHLIVKDIFSATKTTNRITAVESYPEGYPFEYLLQFIVKCKSLVQFFSHHPKMKASLVNLQGNRNLPQLIQPAPTRWGTLLRCMQSLQANEQILHQMVNARTFMTGNTTQQKARLVVKEFVTNDFFPINLEKSISILEPIQRGIVMFQSDKIALSEVYRHFAVTMPEAYSGMASLARNERLYIAQLCEKRLNFLYGDALGLSYLLDPKYMAQGMREDHKNQAQATLHMSGSIGDNDEHATDDAERETLNDKIFTEYLEWTEQTLALKANPNNRLRLFTAKQYWTVEGSKYPALKDLASKVFAMACSSAASERGFSAMSFIHSKLRNRLGAEKVKKLIYIKMNAPKLLNDSEVVDWGRDNGDNDVVEIQEEDDDDEAICILNDSSDDDDDVLGMPELSEYNDDDSDGEHFLHALD